MSAAETDTAITWMNGNEQMTNDHMEMVMKKIFISEMEWNGWNEVEWSEMKWNEMEWSGMEWSEWSQNLWNEREIFFFWKI